jgi:hypothetical protein
MTRKGGEREIMISSRYKQAHRETKTQHLLVVSPGNLFGGLRLSPFDDDFPD